MKRIPYSKYKTDPTKYLTGLIIVQEEDIWVKGERTGPRTIGHLNTKNSFHAILKLDGIATTYVVTEQGHMFPYNKEGSINKRKTRFKYAPLYNN